MSILRLYSLVCLILYHFTAFCQSLRLTLSFGHAVRFLPPNMLFFEKGPGATASQQVSEASDERTSLLGMIPCIYLLEISVCALCPRAVVETTESLC